MANWNNISAHGFGAADDNWGGNGSVARVDLLNRNLERLKHHGKWTLATVTSAMNAAATQDVRAIDTVPLLQRLLDGSAAPNPRAAQMLALLVAWRQHGGSRLDRNLDGKIDDPGAAIMDAAWPKIADAFMRPQLGPQLDELNSLFTRFISRPAASTTAGISTSTATSGTCSASTSRSRSRTTTAATAASAPCQQAVWKAIAAAGAELTAEQGTSNPAAWRADATAERIHFAPGCCRRRCATRTARAGSSR